MTLTRRSLLQAAGTASLAADSLAAGPALTQGDVPAPHLRIVWLGGSTMIITFGNLSILTDPILSETFAMGDPNDPVDHMTVRVHPRLSPVPSINLRTVDLVLLSHLHEDHFDQAEAAAIDPALPFIVASADMDVVRKGGFGNLVGLDWGQKHQLSVGTGSVRITAVAARHSRSCETAQSLGFGNGYWIEFSERDWKRTLCWTRDTMPTDDVTRPALALIATSERGGPYRADSHSRAP